MPQALVKMCLSSSTHICSDTWQNCAKEVPDLPGLRSPDNSTYICNTCCIYDANDRESPRSVVEVPAATLQSLQLLATRQLQGDRHARGVRQWRHCMPSLPLTSVLCPGCAASPAWVRHPAVALLLVGSRSVLTVQEPEYAAGGVGCRASQLCPASGDTRLHSLLSSWTEQ